MNATDMVQGNLALKLEMPAAPSSRLSKAADLVSKHRLLSPSAAGASPRLRPPLPLKVSTIVALAVALTLFFVLATSIFSARHAAYAESVSNVTYETVRVQSGDSLWSLAQEHPIEGLSTQETSDMIRDVNHLEHGLLDAGVHLKVPARS